ncbi:hypothetical protein [Streptomyces sp. NPDC058758]|uniref:hypothetical protein n=1 Tax=Streptomyces sp. NPDC058758 TaxID=3346627 RepID=UPI0036873463
MSALLAGTGEVDVLAGTLVLLLLVVFFNVNTEALVLRHDRSAHADHFRAPTAVPVLGALSCVLLATQIEAGVRARGLVLMGVGAVLGALVLLRRRGDGSPPTMTAARAPADLPTPFARRGREETARAVAGSAGRRGRRPRGTDTEDRPGASGHRPEAEGERKPETGVPPEPESSGAPRTTPSWAEGERREDDGAGD